MTNKPIPEMPRLEENKKLTLTERVLQDMVTAHMANLKSRVHA